MIKKLASIRLFFILSFILIAAMTAGTLIPQNQSQEKYHEIFSHSTYMLLHRSGLLDVYHSIWFISLLALLGLNTSSCIYQRVSNLRFNRLPWGALMSHTAILVILLGGVVSAIFGEKGTLQLVIGESGCCVPSGEKKTIHLPFQIRLKNFNVEYYKEGEHWIHLADLQKGWQETIEVQPEKEYVLKEKIKVKVLRYVPDFRMEKDPKTGEWSSYTASLSPMNPALEIEISASPSEKKWLFAKYPDFSHKEGRGNLCNGLQVQYQYVPGKVKQFVSHIDVVEMKMDSHHGHADIQLASAHPAKKERKSLASGMVSVNHPFKYGGYTFYQSGYDPDNPDFSSFQVAKDPGVMIVYAGFILLPAGLSISFYKKKNINESEKKTEGAVL